MLLTSPLVIYPAAVMATTMAASAFVWFRKPGVIIKLLFRLALYKVGLRIHYIVAGQYRYCYAERGKACSEKPSLLLVHGFSSSKDMWVPIVQRIPQDVHVVVVDLPGHGDTTMPGYSDDISAERLAECLHEFVTAIGLQTPFHMVGTSLGGAISLMYTASHPDDVCKLTTVCPAMKTPEKTEFLKEVEAGHCRLIPNTVDELKYMMDSCMYHKIKISKQFLHGVLQLRTPKNAFFTRLFNELSTQDNHEKLMAKVDTIKVPTQVIWGKQDELIHVSGAEVLRERMTNLQHLELLDDCGHSCNLDRPGMVIKNLLYFYNRDVKKVQ